MVPFLAIVRSLGEFRALPFAVDTKVVGVLSGSEKRTMPCAPWLALKMLVPSVAKPFEPESAMSSTTLPSPLSFEMRDGGATPLPLNSEKYSEPPIQTGPSTFVKSLPVLLNVSASGTLTTRSAVAVAPGSALAVKGPDGQDQPPPLLVALPAAAPAAATPPLLEVPPEPVPLTLGTPPPAGVLPPSGVLPAEPVIPAVLGPPPFPLAAPLALLPPPLPPSSPELPHAIATQARLKVMGAASDRKLHLIFAGVLACSCNRPPQMPGRAAL